MKTIKQWIGTLDPEIRKKALKHARIYHSSRLPKRKYTSLLSAMTCSFIWIDTIEGHDYWFNIAKKYQYENNKRMD